MSMKTLRWTWAAFALTMSLLCAGRADDPEPRGRGVFMLGGSPSRNLANLFEKNLVKDFAPDVKDQELNPRAAAKNLKWKQKLGGRAYCTPVIAGGRIFVGTNNDQPRDEALEGDRGVLMCFRESDGEFLWQITHQKIDEDNYAPHEGVTSTPCVDGDRLYYVSNRGELVCADVKGDEKAKKGKIVWTYDMVKELDVYVCRGLCSAYAVPTSSPLVVGDLVYVLTGNGVDRNTSKGGGQKGARRTGYDLPKPKAPALVAVNKKTGKKVWTNDLPGDKVMVGQWSSPAATEVNGTWQVIYGGGDGWLYGLDAKDGELIWKFDLNPRKATPYKPGGSGEQCFVIATPVIHDNKCYVAVGQDPEDGPGVGRLWCIDVTKKPKNKNRDLTPFSTTVKVGDEEDERFSAKDRRNKDSGLVWHHGGKVLPWPNDDSREFVFGRTTASVVVQGGVVYATELNGYLQALDAKTGEQLWEHDFQESTHCPPSYADGRIYQGTDGNTLYVYQAGRKPNAPKKVAFGRNLKVPPVASKGVLYVNSGTYLYAFAPEKKK